MTRHEVMTTIRTFLAEKDPDKVNTIQEETNLMEASLLDSFMIVSMVAFLEEQFGCSLNDDDLIEENFASLGAMANLILRKSPLSP